MNTDNLRTKTTIIALATLVSCGAMAANAQTASQALLEEVVVTATKKKNVENVQDIPAAISVFGEAQLDALKVRDITDLSFSTPNVALDDIGTAKGTANFTIRGLGVNSSIPSIDPAVGVFVDGLYYGINAGVIFDTFDLESVEILRGPQGVLFGRNVTGGAVILNTGDPDFEQTTKFKAAVESGLRGTGANYYLQGATTGTLIKDKLAGKLAIYYNDDKGWFENTLADGSKVDFGANDTLILRPSITWLPNDSSEITVKYEHGEYSGAGPAAQSHTNGAGVDGQVRNFSRDSFDFSVNEGTFNDSEWDNLTVEANFDVAFGDGRITNVLGYREYSSLGLSDIDASSARIFDAEFGYEQDQISNELRYNGQFGKWNITTGLFYFEQDLKYSEVRFILQDFFESIGGSTSVRPGGGVLDQRTIGVFATADFEVNEKLTLNAGLRYSDEEKNVSVASVLPGVQSDTSCRVTNGDCRFDFSEQTNPGQTSFETDNISPKLGFKYTLSDNNRLYGHWTRSFRAGGFNFRNTASDTVNFGPGPFQDEEVDSFELGWKSEPTDRSKLNISVFKTTIDDLQREINRSDPVAGVIQVIRNTADAEITGLEVDGQIAISDNLILMGSLGYLDGEYKRIFSDISGDGVVNSTDFNLGIPRLADLTYNLGIVYESDLGNLGRGSFLVNYSHRDETPYTDNNLGFINENDRVDATFTLTRESGLSFSLYGKNITDEVTFGNDTQLPATLGPAALGGTFAPLTKGRVFGLEIQGEF
ncbi:MAG: TonB-dependent receptor [Arenicella sp.]|nr:TonB-dependent receptor [Arenicella sp.]